MCVCVYTPGARLAFVNVHKYRKLNYLHSDIYMLKYLFSVTGSHVGPVLSTITNWHINSSCHSLFDKNNNCLFKLEQRALSTAANSSTLSSLI